MIIKCNQTVVYFLVEHRQQHVIVRGEQLVDPGSLKQGAENLQQLDWTQQQQHNNLFLFI